ncbi:MAG: tryptophan synthase subunit alpha [Planctomycetota bacterium]
MSLAPAIRSKRPALIPFIAGGYPSVDVLAETVRQVTDAGAAAIEIGIPFSDPIADGPTIQSAYTDALAEGSTVEKVLDAVATVEPTVPRLAMVSHSVVFRHGPAKFCDQLKAAGITGLLIPDLPLGEAESVCDTVRAAGIDTVLLVAPTTPRARREKIANLASGFVYYLSVAGITGARDRLPENLAENVRELKQMTDTPVCVGFGIGNVEQVAAVNEVADGAIVGSALVKAMTDTPDPAAAAGSFVRTLLG